MRVILHIGTEKTGTTTIQSSLVGNTKRLADHGFHVVECTAGSNHRLLALAFTYADRPDGAPGGSPPHLERPSEIRNFFDAFHLEMTSLPSNIHTVIISSEHLQSRLVRQSQVDALESLLSRYARSVEVVCYIRPQADMCTSLYSTALKEGFTTSFRDFIEQCHPESSYYNFSDMLSRWRASFGRSSMHVRLFDRGEMLNGDVLDDFISQLDGALVSDLDRQTPRANESLTPGGQAITLAANRALGPGLSRDAIRRIVTTQLPGRGQQMTPENWHEIQQSFAESNEEVRSEYFPERNELFPLKPPTDQDNSLEPQFIDTLTAAFSAIHETPHEIALPDRFAPILRDFAISLESSDLESAITAMEIAAKIRPHGAFIQQKLAEYKRTLSQSTPMGSASSELS